jgi:hypothetical protein
MDEPAIGNATTLLLTCMDFRYPEAIVEYMKREGLTLKYYHVILAGASLGAVLDTPPHLKLQWQTTFFDHLDIVLTPPGAITQVYILDHRDCKAYRIFRGLPEDVDRDTETRAHRLEMNKLKNLIQQRYNGLHVECSLLERRKGEEEFRALEVE